MSNPSIKKKAIGLSVLVLTIIGIGYVATLDSAAKKEAKQSKAVATVKSREKYEPVPTEVLQADWDGKDLTIVIRHDRWQFGWTMLERIALHANDQSYAFRPTMSWRLAERYKEDGYARIWTHTLRTAAIQDPDLTLDWKCRVENHLDGSPLSPECDVKVVATQNPTTGHSQKTIP